MPSRYLDVSFCVPASHGGARVSVEASALVCFDVFAPPDRDEHLLRLNGISLTSATVNDELLSEEELRHFEQDYEPEYREDLEWLALSSLP